ncbi:MAG: hypothetical protein QOG57_4094 [Pseudonocardiales bacterium]|nr:hypothetical protein [Pseudonocardiales bacterium]
MSTVRGVINAESERVFCFLAAGWSYSLSSLNGTRRTGLAADNRPSGVFSA